MVPRQRVVHMRLFLCVFVFYMC
uniref:Uncharacterized protein n=1 Tax=Anopheles dirus TaxID=7168 RepID=A0A182NYU5_9DIPT